MDLNMILSRWFYAICIGCVFAVNVVFAGGLGGHWHVDTVTPETFQLFEEVHKNTLKQSSDKVMEFHQKPLEIQKVTPAPTPQEYHDAFQYFHDNLSYLNELMFYLHMAVRQ